MKDTYIFAIDYTSSPKFKQSVGVRGQSTQNLKFNTPMHPSARSLKFRYQNLENRHPSARSLKKYVKEIKGKVEIYGLFYTNILFVSRI